MHLTMMSQNRNQITIIIVVPLAHSAQWDCHQMVGVLETMIATRIIDGRNGSWGGWGMDPPSFPPSSSPAPQQNAHFRWRGNSGPPCSCQMYRRAQPPDDQTRSGLSALSKSSMRWAISQAESRERTAAPLTPGSSTSTSHGPALI